MTNRRAALCLAGLRAALGVAAILAPGAAGRAWIGPDASGRDRHVLLRALGGRDLALGVGALLADRRGRDVRGWIAMGAVSDLVDTVATAAGFGALPRLRRWMVLMASAGAVAGGVALAASASEGGSPHPT